MEEQCRNSPTSVGSDNSCLKNEIKAKIRKCHGKVLPTATAISIIGTINIHNADNVHIGHNYTVTSTESSQPAEVPPKLEIKGNKALKRLLASDSAIQNRHRIAISKYVGSNWRCLGKELGGFSSSQMDQLEEKFKAELIPFDEMICQLILKWEDHSQVKPTVGRLAQALFQCQMTSALGSIVDMDKV